MGEPGRRRLKGGQQVVPHAGAQKSAGDVHRILEIGDLLEYGPAGEFRPRHPEPGAHDAGGCRQRRHAACAGPTQETHHHGLELVIARVRGDHPRLESAGDPAKKAPSSGAPRGLALARRSRSLAHDREPQSARFRRHERGRVGRVPPSTMIEGGHRRNSLGGPPRHRLQQHHGVTPPGHGQHQRSDDGRDGHLERRLQQRVGRKVRDIGHSGLITLWR